MWHRRLGIIGIIFWAIILAVGIPTYIIRSMQPRTQSGSLEEGEPARFVTESNACVDLFVERGR